MANEGILNVFVETPSGERFVADVPCETKISQIAVDFFESRGGPPSDRKGHAQRGVVELVDRSNPDTTKRLDSRKGLCESGVENGDTLRILLESRAGTVDQHARLVALTMDYNEMQALSEQNPRITFTVNRTQAPDLYNLTLHYTSFVKLLSPKDEPRKADQHRVEIMLGAQYPRRAPIVTWQTPIFHPNISQPEGTVCLGVLQEYYLPGMGLARLVRMLIEILQWRNFDASHSFNLEAAEWAENIENWTAIEAIGGYPLQGPLEEFIRELDRALHPPTVFRQCSPNQ